jgi:hypothetical protein
LFLIYVDSSGRPYNDTENYVVASITTNEEDWQSIDNLEKQVKIKHFPNLPDEDIEIHAKDMVNHDGLFSTLSWNQIYAIFDDVFDIFSSTSKLLTINAVVIKKINLKKKSIDVEEWAYRLLFERLNRFLERKNEELLASQHPRQYGIMIMDSEGTIADRRLRNKIIQILRRGTQYSNLTYLIEDPLFTDSKWRNLSQLVDNVAYCIRRNHRINNNPYAPNIQKWEFYYNNKIVPHFDAPHGSYYGYGLKIFP